MVKGAAPEIAAAGSLSSLAVLRFRDGDKDEIEVAADTDAAKGSTGTAAEDGCAAAVAVVAAVAVGVVTGLGLVAASLELATRVGTTRRGLR